MELQGSPAEEVVTAAERWEADLVVLGGGRGLLDRILLGSTADAVRDHAPCSVLLAKALPDRGKILAPVDGSTTSRIAAHTGYHLALSWHQRFTLLHAIRPHWHTTYDEVILEEIQARARAGVEVETLPEIDRVVRMGDPREIITLEAQGAPPDLIIMGTRGLTGVRRLLSGSVTKHVSHAAKVPVLVVRPT